MRFPIRLRTLAAAALLALGATAMLHAATVTLPTKVMVQKGKSVEFIPLFKGTDTNATAITPTAATQPSHGSLTLLPSQSTYWRYIKRSATDSGYKRILVTWFKYTPDPSFTGIDSFTYSVNDGLAESNVSTCVIKVHPREGTADPFRMTVLILVNTTIQSALTTEINRLKSDLENEGYLGKIKTFPNLTSESETNSKILWDTLVAEYSRTDQMVAGALMIGRFPGGPTSNAGVKGDETFWNMSTFYPQYKRDSMQYHICRDSAVPFIAHSSASGLTDFVKRYIVTDGYSSWTLRSRSLLHIWTGRIDPTGIPAGHLSAGGAVAHIKRALDANHDYRTGLSRYTRNAYHFNLFDSSNKAYSMDSLRQVWPSAAKIKWVGRYTVVPVPPDTATLITPVFPVYLAGHTGEAWDFGCHGNINLFNPSNSGQQYARHTMDTLMRRPFQFRFMFFSGCHASPAITASPLFTRGGGCVLTVSTYDYIHGFTYSPARVSEPTRSVLRRELAGGESWGRAWLNSCSPFGNFAMFGDPSLKANMTPSNDVPVVSSLVRSRPSAGRFQFTATASDPDNSPGGLSYEWWFRSYDFGRNEPDTITTVPVVAVDSSRCPGTLRLEVVDSYKARFFVELYAYRDAVNPAVTLPVGLATEAPALAVPPATTGLSVYPNPFRPSCHVRAELAQAGLMKLEVFAADGRKIRTLSTGHRQAGAVTVSWNGRDAMERPLAAGIYFLKLTANGKTYQRQVVLAR